jgi:hypothetical protein
MGKLVQKYALVGADTVIHVYVVLYQEMEIELALHVRMAAPEKPAQ